jgi:formylglycine-generating enzyme required for sulfatase activity
MRCVTAAVVILLGLVACTAMADAEPARHVNPADGAIVVWVAGTREACPGGKVRMGTSAGEMGALLRANAWKADWDGYAQSERPVHGVELTGFWIYRSEVTVGQYARFIGATRHRPPYEWDAQKGAPDLPVVGVTWDDAAAYCEWAGAALPSEAQWEYAARGPERLIYPWGNAWDRSRCNGPEYQAGKALPNEASCQAWFASLSRTVPALLGMRRQGGSFPSGASWCGAMDMAGNVSEWCADWYDEGFYASPAAIGTDPVCAKMVTDQRSLRGALTLNPSPAFDGRSAFRGHTSPLLPNDPGVRLFVGFRPVLLRSNPPKSAALPQRPQ